jgi:hypothetical protein
MIPGRENAFAGKAPATSSFKKWNEQGASTLLIPFFGIISLCVIKYKPT